MADIQSSPASAASVDDSRTVIYQIQKNSRERVRICLTQYRGNEYLELRVWYPDIAGEYQPSRNGFLMKPSLLPELMQGLQLAARAVDPAGAR